MGGEGSGVALPPSRPEGLPDDLDNITVPDELRKILFWSAVTQAGDAREAALICLNPGQEGMVKGEEEGLVVDGWRPGC